MDKLLQFNNKLIKSGNSIICKKKTVDPYNPLDLPPNTIRVKFKSGYTPDMGDTQTLVDADENVWDIYKQSNDWTNLFEIQYNESFDNLLEVLGANTTNVTKMTYLFSNCTSLSSIAIFDTSNVTTMYAMFQGCTSLESVPLFNTSNVTDMRSMFYNCSSLTSVPLFDTSKVTDMIYMFEGCTSLTTVPLFDTSKVTSMLEIFRGCTSLTTVPLFDTSNVESLSWMFEDCTSLTTVPLFNTSKVTSLNGMLYNCYNVQSGALALYQQASSQENPPTFHYYTFTNCGTNTQTGAAELAQIPSDWK